MTTSSRRPSPAARGTRRSRRPAPRSTTFLERNRSRLTWAAGALIVVILVGLAYLGFTRTTYACTNEWQPAATPVWSAPTQAPLESGATPAPAITPPPPGYVQPDMGDGHAAPGSLITYRNCPPASGKHYNAQGQGPIRGGLYGPGDTALPTGWVHNLEHGAIVLLYKCPGPGCDDTGQQQLEELLATWPNSPICNIPPGATSGTPVIARFDDMAWNYAALVWDVVLPMDAIDEDLLFEFYETRGERNNQEKQCAAPTPTPGPATPTPAATEAPSPSAAASPADSASPEPAATTGPSPS